MLNKTLIILGMHRSGTSFTAQQIHLSGINLGDEMLGSGIGNVNGHFEDLDFYNFHEKIFQNNNISYGGFSVPSKINITEEQKKEAINIVNKKNTLYQEWGWKDPRTCLFIDFWNSIIPNSKILILFRDYDDVVSSLINRDLKTIYIKKTLYEKLFRNDKKIINQLKELYFNSWIEYNQRILNFIKTKDSNNILVLSFSDLAKNIKPLFTYINEVWNFSSLEINQEKIVSFDKSLLSSKKHYGFKQSKKIELANSIFLELEKQSLDSLKKLKK